MRVDSRSIHAVELHVYTMYTPFFPTTSITLLTFEYVWDFPLFWFLFSRCCSQLAVRSLPVCSGNLAPLRTSLFYRRRKHQTNRVNPPERIESHAKSNYTARTHTHLRSTKVPRHLQLSVRWSVTWTIVSRCDRCNNNHNNHRVTSSCTHCVVLIKEKGVYIFWSLL